MLEVGDVVLKWGDGVLTVNGTAVTSAQAEGVYFARGWDNCDRGEDTTPPWTMDRTRFRAGCVNLTMDQLDHALEWINGLEGFWD